MSAGWWLPDQAARFFPLRPADARGDKHRAAAAMAAGDADASKEGGAAAPAKDAKAKPPPAAPELSEEDIALKERLELYVTRTADADPGVAKLAMEELRKEIRSATRRVRASAACVCAS